MLRLVLTIGILTGLALGACECAESACECEQITQTDEKILQAGDSDMSASFEKICSENGFDVETYYVTTEDDYILKLYRIPKPSNESSSTDRPVIFF